MSKVHTRPGAIWREITKNLGRKPATRMYPKERPFLPPNFRGRPVFNPKGGCVGCMLCVKDCPSDAVKITKIEEKHFSCTFNLGNCIYCGQCADSCPKKVISMSKEFELATFDRSTLTNTTDGDSPWLAVQQKSMPDSARQLKLSADLPPPKVEETKPSSEEVACETPEIPETKA